MEWADCIEKMLESHAEANSPNLEGRLAKANVGQLGPTDPHPA